MGCLSIVGRLVSTFARRDVFDPILCNCFIGGKRQANTNRRRLPDKRRCRPDESFAEFEIRGIRVKAISKYPLEFSVHADASTDTTALHIRSSVGGIMSENSTSLIVNSGRQSFSPMACLTPISPMIVARTDAQARFISIISSTKWQATSVQGFAASGTFTRVTAKTRSTA